MSELSERDERLVSGYVDGQLDGDAAVAFERRLLAEPVLRRAVDEQRQVRGWFGSAGDDGDAQGPAPGFADRVLDRVRRLPVADAGSAVGSAAGEVLQVGRRRFARLIR